MANKQASDLPDDQNFLVQAGQEFAVNNSHGFDDILFRVSFGSGDKGQQVTFPGPTGASRNKWFIFEGHCAILNPNGTPALQFFSKVPL